MILVVGTGFKMAPNSTENEMIWSRIKKIHLYDPLISVYRALWFAIFSDILRIKLDINQSISNTWMRALILATI